MTPRVNLNSMLSLVSGPEKEDAWQLILALYGLEKFTQAFRVAVELFNFSAFQIGRARDERNSADAASGIDAYRVWKEKSSIFAGWQHMAAKDGALQIYHIGAVMQSAGVQLKNVPTIRGLVESQRLRTARRLFQSYFPNYVLIRDAEMLWPIPIMKSLRMQALSVCMRRRKSTFLD